MATAAEPRPAELPLPGGREGARVKLHPLLTGEMSGPDAWFLREEGRMAWRHAFGFGVKQGGLADGAGAGLPRRAPRCRADPDRHRLPSVGGGQADWPTSVASRNSPSSDIQMKPDQAVSSQLRARGIEPSAVKAVVMTHLHLDHASAISEYPDVDVRRERAEWAAASEHGQFHGYVKRQFDHGFDWRLLDFEGRDAESFSGFARSFDLFGDGSVRAVYTPGHTLGHMSVVAAHGARRGARRRATRSICAARSTTPISPTAPRTSTSSALAARDPPVRDRDARGRDRARPRLGGLAGARSRSTELRPRLDRR